MPIIIDDLLTLSLHNIANFPFYMCSAGLGRSGAYLAIDMGIQQVCVCAPIHMGIHVHWHLWLLRQVLSCLTNRIVISPVRMSLSSRYNFFHKTACLWCNTAEIMPHLALVTCVLLVNHHEVFQPLLINIKNYVPVMCVYVCSLRRKVWSIHCTISVNWGRTEGESSRQWWDRVWEPLPELQACACHQT